MIQAQESHTYLQIIQHISHVAAVVQGISIGAFSFRNLALALENISKVTPCCQEEKTVFRKSYNPITHDRLSKYQEVPQGDKPHKETIFMEGEGRLFFFFSLAVWISASYCEIHISKRVICIHSVYI